MSQLLVDDIVNKDDTGSPGFSKGAIITGVTTSTGFDGSGADLTNIPAAQLTGTLPAISGANLTGIDNINEGNTKAEVVDTGTDGHFLVETEGTERFRITSTGQIRIDQATGANNGIRMRQSGWNYDFRIGAVGASGGSIWLGQNYDPSGNAVDFSSNGSNYLRFTTGGDIRLGTGAPNTLPEERLRIDSSGRVLQGLTSAKFGFFNDVNAPPVFQIQGDTYYDSAFSIFRDGTGASGPNFILAKGRGAIVQDNDVLGTISFQGHDGTTELIEGASIVTEVDGTPAANNVPSALVFKTNSGTSTTSERLRVGSAGQIGIGSANYGTVGQVLTSGGASGAVSWTTVSGGGGGGSSDKIEEGNTKAEVVDTGSDGHFLVETEGTERLRIDETGRVLIGNGGATVYANANADDLVVGHTGTGQRSGITIVADSNQDARLAFSKGTSFFDALAGYIMYEFWNNKMSFYVNMSERLAIDSNGKLLLGFNGGNSQVSTAQIQVQGGDSANHIAILNSAASDSDGARGGVLSFHGKNSGNTRKTLAFIEASHDGSANDEKGRLVFKTNDGSDGDAPTERLRIESQGQVNVFADSTVHIARSGTSAGTVQWLYAGAHTASNTNSGTISFQVYTNGNVQNTNNSYGAISDVKLKENIVDANSQWSDIKNLKVRNFNFKEGQTHKQLGLVAQEVESVSAGLVFESPDLDNDGNDLGTVTKSVKYSVVHMKAIKALQEAMARIETLESEVATLKGS